MEKAMNHFSTIEALKADYQRYRILGESSIGIVFFTQGFWATMVYRLTHPLMNKLKIPIIGPIFHLFILFSQKVIEVLTGISIPAGCTIGKGLYIGHFGPIIVNDKAIIGEDCSLSQGITIGSKQRGQKSGVPTIGDRVYIGPNSVIIGNIHIGNDAAIGAGAIVVDSVPDNAVVAGNPACIISSKGSSSLVVY